jgi:peptidoglycan hydrolase-like protein with peptidoglycan-binding domain
MKRKDVLETEQLNEVAPLVAALMGALVGAGIQRNVAQRAAQQAVADPEVAQTAGAAGGAAARPATGGNYEDTMRNGSRGEGVRQLQQALGMQQVDGIFGPNTERAVRQFQQSQGLQVDGIVGPETRARIERMASDGASDEDPATAAAEPAAAEPAAEPAGPNADQRDADRERAAQAAPNNGAPQASPNRTAGAPSRLQIRQRIAPEMERLLQLASKDFRGYTAIMEGKGLAEALDPPQKAQLQQLLNQVRAAAQNDPQVNTEFADLIARAQRALGIGTTNPNDTTGQPDLSPNGPNAAEPTAAPAPAPGSPTGQPGTVGNPIAYPDRAAAIRAHGNNLISARPNLTSLPRNTVLITIAGQPFIAQPARAPVTRTPPELPTQPGMPAESKTMKNKKSINEASVNINGTAEEIAELMRMMQLAGATGAKPVDATDINPGPKPCPICGKIHGPMPKPSGCGGAPMQGPQEPDMGDMIRMMSVDEENEDGGFQDATTEPVDTYMGSNAGDVSDVIPDGNDLHKEKGSYPATAGGDNPMNIKETLWKALQEKKNKKKKPDADGDGVPNWADKKPGEDDHAGKKKGSKSKKGQVPPQFKKKKK